MKKSGILITTFLLTILTAINAQKQVPIVVKANQIVSEVQPTMWGVFFEDINLGADGGIYAELVKNRSFEFFKPFMGWQIKQDFFDESAFQVINNKQANSRNPRFIRVTKKNAIAGLSLTNEGFRGMGIKKGLRYDFSMMYKQMTGGLGLRLELLNNNGAIIGKTENLPFVSGNADWKKLAVSFTSTDSASKDKLRLVFTGSGSMDIDLVSLFPSDTWKGRPGGLRADMVQLLADMKPGFIRFPGGCIVEGPDLSQRYQWKNTIGPVEERELLVNRWNFEFAHRPAPDYYQTFGLGFFEYFQLAEDMGAEPLPILNCGMACQYNSGELVPLDQLGPYIQDALDLVEFANGDVNSTWGKKRAEMGHPAPFNLKMMGIGNENWGEQYLERLALFTKALKDKYPEIKIINSSGTAPDGERFQLLDSAFRKNEVDIIDEHYYRPPEWFLANAGRYDNYPRNGPKIFGGEYAAHTNRVPNGPGKNTWYAAISEAAFMTGLERNAAVVNLASYAPLFAHIDGWQWTPDLIWVNNLQSYGTPNYFVQKMYSLNKGTHVIPALMDGAAIKGQDSLYVSAVVDKEKQEIIIKIVNTSPQIQNKLIVLEGVGKLNPEIEITTLANNDLGAVNTFTEPDKITTREAKASFTGKNKIAFAAAPYSFSLIKIRMR